MRVCDTRHYDITIFISFNVKYANAALLTREHMVNGRFAVERYKLEAHIRCRIKLCFITYIWNRIELPPISDHFLFVHNFILLTCKLNFLFFDANSSKWRYFYDEREQTYFLTGWSSIPVTHINLPTSLPAILAHATSILAKRHAELWMYVSQRPMIASWRSHSARKSTRRRWRKRLPRTWNGTRNASCWSRSRETPRKLSSQPCTVTSWVSTNSSAPSAYRSRVRETQKSMVRLQ